MKHWHKNKFDLPALFTCKKWRWFKILLAPHGKKNPYRDSAVSHVCYSKVWTDDQFNRNGPSGLEETKWEELCHEKSATVDFGGLIVTNSPLGHIRTSPGQTCKWTWEPQRTWTCTPDLRGRRIFWNVSGLTCGSFSASGNRSQTGINGEDFWNNVLSLNTCLILVVTKKTKLNLPLEEICSDLHLAPGIQSWTSYQELSEKCLWKTFGFRCSIVGLQSPSPETQSSCGDNPFEPGERKMAGLKLSQLMST